MLSNLRNFIHELRHDLRLRSSGNKEILGKFQNCMWSQSIVQSLLQKYFFGTNAQNISKIVYQSFSGFVWLCLISQFFSKCFAENCLQKQTLQLVPVSLNFQFFDIFHLLTSKSFWIFYEKNFKQPSCEKLSNFKVLYNSHLAFCRLFEFKSRIEFRKLPTFVGSNIFDRFSW